MRLSSHTKVLRALLSMIKKVFNLFWRKHPPIQPSLFLTLLNYDIRFLIYKQLFSDTSASVWTNRPILDTDLPGFLLTNKQICKEASPIIWRHAFVGFDPKEAGWTYTPFLTWPKPEGHTWRWPFQFWYWRKVKTDPFPPGYLVVQRSWSSLRYIAIEDVTWIVLNTDARNAFEAQFPNLVTLKLVSKWTPRMYTTPEPKASESIPESEEPESPQWPLPLFGPGRHALRSNSRLNFLQSSEVPPDAKLVRVIETLFWAIFVAAYSHGKRPGVQRLYQFQVLFNVGGKEDALVSALLKWQAHSLP